MEENWLLGGVDAKDVNVSGEREYNTPGMYVPNMKKVKDQSVGYSAKIRFLLNMTKEGKQGLASIKVFKHFSKLQNGLGGSIVCNKNSTTSCELCDTFYALDKSSNDVIKQKAKLIGAGPKFYSYVQIIEDNQQPELVGKIMVFEYGVKIQKKIDAYKNDPDGSCNIYDFVDGRDFRLIIKKGENNDYDSCKFLDVTPLRYFSKEQNAFVALPMVDVVDSNGVSKKKIDPKASAKLKAMLLDREMELESVVPSAWDDATTKRVQKIKEALLGNTTQTSHTSAPAPAPAKTQDEFFNMSDVKVDDDLPF